MSARPSSREITNKVRDALAAVRSGQRIFALQKHLVADLDGLGLQSADEYWQCIDTFLSEILAAGPVQCYAGGRPPQRSYEAGIRNAELWAYAWKSPSRRQVLYLKFALQNGWYFHIDCHESTQP